MIMPGAPGGTSPNFFSPAQAHMEEFVPSALVATNMPSPGARGQISGMAHPAQPGKTSRGGWLQQMASRFVSTGKSQGDASPQATPIGTGARVVGKLTMGPRDALGWRRLKALTLLRLGGPSAKARLGGGSLDHLMEAKRR